MSQLRAFVEKVIRKTVEAKDRVVERFSDAVDTTVARALRRPIRIRVEPHSETIVVGIPRKFKAYALYSEAPRKKGKVNFHEEDPRLRDLEQAVRENEAEDVTHEVVWTSSAPKVVSIKNGRAAALGVSEKVIFITAEHKSGVRDSCQVNVVGFKSIEIDPENHELHGLGKLQYRAIANFTDGSSDNWIRRANWSALPSNVVSIEKDGDRAGLTTLRGVGSATITAKDKQTGFPGSTKLKISLPAKGAQATNVQIIVQDSKGNAKPDGFRAEVVFNSVVSDPYPTVVATQNGALEFTGLFLMGEGSVVFQAADAPKSNRAVAQYKRTGNFMTFLAKQRSESSEEYDIVQK